jgi:hypothetical protein
MDIDAIDKAFEDNPGDLDYLDMSGQHQRPYRINYNFDGDGVDHYTIWAGKKCFIEYTFDKGFTILYITYFYCEGEEKKTGAKMLHDLLIQLKQLYPTLTSIILTADARVDYHGEKTKSTGDIEVDQAKLNKYYADIGFIKRSDNNIFDGQVDTIITTIRSTITGGKRNKRGSRTKRALKNKKKRNKKTRNKYSRHYR